MRTRRRSTGGFIAWLVVPCSLVGLAAPVEGQRAERQLEAATVAGMEESELRRATSALFRDRALNPRKLAPSWQALEEGSFDAFLAGEGRYTKVFSAQDGSAAAVVTYARAVAEGVPTVTAELELRGRTGAAVGRFEVIPYLEFAIAPGGAAVVGHGEHMEVAITDGVLHTSLAFYDRSGTLRREVRSMEFSPSHSTAIFAGERTLALAVLGRVIGYDLDTGEERWRFDLERPGDLPFLIGAPDGRRASVTVLGEEGGTSVMLLDGSGSPRGRFALAGRTLPGDGVAFDPSGQVLVVRDIRGADTDVHLFDGRSLRRIRTLRDR